MRRLGRIVRDRVEGLEEGDYAGIQADIKRWFARVRRHAGGLFRDGRGPVSVGCALR